MQAAVQGFRQQNRAASDAGRGSQGRMILGGIVGAKCCRRVQGLEKPGKLVEDLRSPWSRGLHVRKLVVRRRVSSLGCFKAQAGSLTGNNVEQNLAREVDETRSSISFSLPYLFHLRVYSQ